MPLILETLPVEFAALLDAPFLPRGKGALILILGGIVVLGMSMFWSFFVPRRLGAIPHTVAAFRSAPHQLAREYRAPRRSVGDAPLVKLEYWIAAVLATASRAGLGRPQMVQSDAFPHVLLLEDCQSCRGRRAGSDCEHERSTLERVLQAFAPGGTVVELSCNPDGLGACIFELRPGTE